MKITNPRFEYEESGLPVLRLEIDDVPAIIPHQQKPYLLEHNAVTVYLPAEHNDMLQVVELPASKKYGIEKPVKVGGGIQDKELARLARLLVKSVERETFREGPVDV